MARYIELDELLTNIDKRNGRLPLWLDEILTEDCKVADVAPVKRGFWKPISESEMTGFNPKFAGRDPIAGYKCSNCGNEAIFSCNDEFVLSDYCPNCGADMSNT